MGLKTKIIMALALLQRAGQDGSPSILEPLNPRTKLYSKDERIICGNVACKDPVIAVLRRDFFVDDEIDENTFTWEGGQGPWLRRDAMKCRSCGAKWSL